MIFLTLKFCRWLYRTLNGNASPWQIGLGVVLGALAGLLPLGLGTFAAFVVILLVNVHFSTACFSYAVFQAISLAAQGWLIRPLGQRALDVAPHGPVVAAAQTPILSLLRLDYYDVSGAIALWLVIAIPLMAAATWGYARYQDRLRAKLAKSKTMKFLSQLWFFKGLKYVFVGY